MTDNLKPCPFCGWYEIVLDENIMIGNKPVYVCTHCQSLSSDWNTRPIEDALRAQLAEAQAEVYRLTVQLEEAGKALSGLGYTPSADDSGSYDSLIPDKYL